MDKKETKETGKKTQPYTMKDAIQVADDIFQLTKDKKYNLGAFIHGLVFALEYAQHSYNVPQQQIATIKRDCRKYFQQIDDFQKIKS
jgi:hypothetical protein